MKSLLASSTLPAINSQALKGEFTIKNDKTNLNINYIMNLNYNKKI